MAAASVAIASWARPGAPTAFHGCRQPSRRGGSATGGGVGHAWPRRVPFLPPTGLAGCAATIPLHQDTQVRSVAAKSERMHFPLGDHPFLPPAVCRGFAVVFAHFQERRAGSLTAVLRPALAAEPERVALTHRAPSCLAHARGTSAGPRPRIGPSAAHASAPEGTSVHRGAEGTRWLAAETERSPRPSWLRRSPQLFMHQRFPIFAQPTFPIVHLRAAGGRTGTGVRCAAAGAPWAPPSVLVCPGSRMEQPWHQAVGGKNGTPARPRGAAHRVHHPSARRPAPRPAARPTAPPLPLPRGRPCLRPPPLP